MGYEVEVKYRLADASTVIDRLRSMGAQERAATKHADLYLAHPNRDFAQTDEALRLRRIGDENHVTYKGPKRGGPAKIREEIEIPFASGPNRFSELSTVFERLGFRPVALVEKTRAEFLYEVAGRTVSFTLDDVGELGRFVEIETLAEDDDALPQAQAIVLELASRLGLSDVEPRSYLRMTLERSGKR